MSNIKNFLNLIDKSSIIAIVKKNNKNFNWELVKDGLNKLDSMIGLVDLKNSVIIKIKEYIVDIVKDNHQGGLNHCMLYGPPGVGKTKISEHLSLIFSGLGFLSSKTLRKEEKDKNPTEIINSLNQFFGGMISFELSEEEEYKDIEFEEFDKMQKSVYDSINEAIDKLKTSYYYKEEESSESKRKRTLESDYSELKRKRKRSSDYKHVYGYSDTAVQIVIDEVNKSLNKLKDFKDKCKVKNKEKTEESFFVKANREDLVAKYLGQTAIKTENFLKKNMGKVIFIDECYSMFNEGKDSYGSESLTVINRFMTEYSGQLLIIMAGYKQEIEESIFKNQKGLRERFGWVFDITGYKKEELCEMLMSGLNNRGIIIENSEVLFKELKYRNNIFPAYGRSVDKLVDKCNAVINECLFENLIESKKEYPILNNVLFNKAIQLYLSSNTTNQNYSNSDMYI